MEFEYVVQTDANSTLFLVLLRSTASYTFFGRVCLYSRPFTLPPTGPCAASAHSKTAESCGYPTPWPRKTNSWCKVHGCLAGIWEWWRDINKLEKYQNSCGRAKTVINYIKCIEIPTFSSMQKECGRVNRDGYHAVFSSETVIVCT